MSTRRLATPTGRSASGATRGSTSVCDPKISLPRGTIQERPVGGGKRHPSPYESRRAGAAESRGRAAAQTCFRAAARLTAAPATHLSCADTGGARVTLRPSGGVELESGESRDSARRPGSALLRCFRGYRGSRPPSAQGRAQPWQSARSAPAIGTIEVSP